MAERSIKNTLSLERLRLPGWRKAYRPRPLGQVTALDLDGQVLRVVQTASRGHRAAVTRVAAQALDLPAEAERSDAAIMGQAIERALASLRVKPGPVVMGVPRAQVVLRALTLPAIDDLRELAAMVYFQVGKDLPFRMDEAVVDFKVGRQIGAAASRPEGNGKSGEAAAEEKTEPAAPKLEVLVAAAKRDVVEFYQQSAQAAGLKLAALGLLPYANARCVEACQVAEGGQAVALVSLRPDEVNIDVIAQEALLFSRGAAVKPHTETASAPALPVPPTEPTMAAAPEDSSNAENAALPPAAPQPETFVDAVTIEVVRTLHSYSGMESSNPVAKIVVAGATGQEVEVVEAIQNRLSVPCSLLDPARALDLPDAAREHADGAIAAIGLALGVNDPQGLPFDFLNPKRPPVQRDMRRVRILGGVAAGVALVVSVLGLRAYLINQRLQIQKAVQFELSEAQKKSPIYKRTIQQAATVKEWVNGGRNWLEHYAWLSAILPPCDEVYLTSLSVSGQGTIRLSVQARSGEILAKLDKQLREAGYEVKPLAITPGADRHGYEFRSSVELIVPDKMKIDLTKARPLARPADDGSLDPALNKGGGG